MTAARPSSSAEYGSRDVALMLVGISLLTSSYRRSEATAVDHVRRNVLHRMYRWQQVANNAASGIEGVLGAAIVAYAVVRVVRRGVAVIEEALDGEGRDAPEAPSTDGAAPLVGQGTTISEGAA